MIQKWDLTEAPFEKDPERHKVRLHASKEDLESLLSAIPVPCSEPFVTLAKDFNWFFYLPSLSPDRKDQVLDLLKNFDRRHTIHGENIAPTPLTYTTPAPQAPAKIDPKTQPAVTEIMGTGIMEEAEDSVLEAEVQSHVKAEPPADAPPVEQSAAAPAPAPVAEPEPVPKVVPAPVEEKDSGLAEITLVEYVGFYPESAKLSFEKIMPLLEEQIKKFKLKIRLSEAARISYQYVAGMSMAFLKDGCASKQCYRAIFLGPEIDAAAEGKFFKEVQSAASEAHITLHRMGAAGVQRESELMNCALEMTIPAARLTASQSPHKRF